MSATLDSTPLRRSNLLFVCRAMICAREVLPVPGHAALHVGQKNILLRFVKAMNLIDKKNRRLPFVFQAIRRRGEDTAHVRNVGFHSTEAFEFALRLPGNDLREGGFARAGWAVKDER